MDTLSPCTCFHLRRAARRVSQLYDQHLAGVGLSLNEYSILHRAQHTRPLGELAEALGMDRTTLTRNLKPLTNAGLVQIMAGDDGRQRCIQLTPEGRQRLQQARPLWRKAQSEIEARCGVSTVHALNQQLDTLHSTLTSVPLP